VSLGRVCVCVFGYNITPQLRGGIDNLVSIRVGSVRRSFLHAAGFLHDLHLCVYRPAVHWLANLVGSKNAPLSLDLVADVDVCVIDDSALGG
jgi:hypothetical protein